MSEAIVTCYTKIMAKDRKKKRKKPSSSNQPPVVHRYNAEEEMKKDKRKKLKIRTIVTSIVLAIALLIYGLLEWLVF